MSRLLRISLLISFFAAGAARADNYSLSGSLGGGYSRDDAWSGGQHDASTAWDWNAGLAFTGSPFRPGLLQFLVGAQYAALRTYYFESRSAADNFGYRVQAAAFTDSPLTLSLGGARSWSEFTTDGQTHETGATQLTSYNGTAVLHVQSYPALRLSVFRNDLDNHMLGGEEAKSTSTVLSAGASHATRTQDYTASYDTSWNSGTYAETNFRSHAVSFAGSVGLTDDVRFHLLDNYYLRLPTLDAPTDPRFDNNILATGLQWLPTPRLTASLSYGYGHILVTAPGTPTIEQVSHSVGAADAYQWTPNLTMQNSASFVSTMEALGDRAGRGAAETVGSSLNWRHVLSPTLQLGLGGGGSIGVAEPEVGGTRLAYGLGGTAGLNYAGPRYLATAAYTASYSQAQLGLDGWDLSQSLTLTGEMTYWNALLRGLLSATGERREDPVLGTFFSRSANLTLSSYWLHYSAQASAGFSDGLSAALRSPNLSDGLFLPAGYNTHSVYATVNGTVALDAGHILLTALARTLATTAPGRPTIYEEGLGVTASYTLGLMTFSLDDRVSTGGYGGLHQTGNLVMLRAIRTFGVGF